jgi:DNA-binding transcriptional MerR regulator
VITISELARFAGVTVKAVRHYHARGLLPEPDRDASGYRRYDAQAAVDLIRIKTLADAGVPLARVHELLSAEQDEFAVAVDEIGRDLSARIRVMEQHRTRVARLTDAASLALPAFVLDYLDRLRALGLSERMVNVEREGWILLCAHRPERSQGWIRMKQESLDDRSYVEGYRLLDLTWDWAPDDPRLVEVADAFAQIAPGLRTAEDDPAAPVPEDFDDTMVALLDSQTVEKVPSWARLIGLLQERGLIGWTDPHYDD